MRQLLHLCIAVLLLIGQAAWASPSSVPDAPAGPVADSTPSGPVKLTILHTNDMHGNLLPSLDKKISETDKVGGAAYVTGLVKQLRASNANVLLIDAGDIAQGTPISNLFHGKPMMEFMNAVGYDAGTLGNHEFDWGGKAMTDMVRWAKHPIVCVNLVEKATGKAPTGVQPFVIKTVGGIKVGITGVITPTTPSMSFKKNVEEFEFLPAADAVRAVLPKMKAAGAQLIVVASHMGEKDEQALAKAVPGIHVIVGGHSHKALHEPILEGETIIVQAGKYTRYLGRLDLTVDTTTWKVTDFTRKAALIPVLNSKIVADPAVAAMVAKYEAQVAPAMSQVLGEAAQDLGKNSEANGGDSPLGNLITDALRWKVESDVALYNAGGIRADINKGPIKVADVYTLLPFDNFVVTLSLTGDQLRQVVEQGAGDHHGTIQVSGLTFRIDTQGKVQDIKVGGQPLDPSKTYRLATVDFLAEGNDGLIALKQGTNHVYDELARDVFAAFVRKNKTLSAPPSGRITRGDATAQDDHGMAQAGGKDACCQDEAKKTGAKDECCQDEAKKTGAKDDCCKDEARKTGAKDDCCKDAAAMTAAMQDCCKDAVKLTAAMHECCKAAVQGGAPAADCCKAALKQAAALKDCCKAALEGAVALKDCCKDAAGKVAAAPTPECCKAGTTHAAGQADCCKDAAKTTTDAKKNDCCKPSAAKHEH